MELDSPQDEAARHERSVERLELCALAVQEVLRELTLELDPQRRADLLIAAEDLADRVVLLLDITRDMAWELPTMVSDVTEG
jgi:hypothetical protein